MADLTTPPAPRVAAGLRNVAAAPWPVQAGLALVGTAVLTASSWIEVPMVPVPMTMQTFAVVMIGALYGWRLGALTVLGWLAQGALGFPVFAGGAGGPAHLVGPTAGYLIAFPIMAALAGWATQAGWIARGYGRAVAVMLAAHGVAFAFGVSWLATHIGVTAAVSAGLAPFLPGMALKSILAGGLARVVLAPRRAG